MRQKMTTYLTIAIAILVVGFALFFAMVQQGY